METDNRVSGHRLVEEGIDLDGFISAVCDCQDDCSLSSVAIVQNIEGAEGAVYS